MDVTFTLWDTETGGTQLGSGFSDTDTVTPNAGGIYDTLIGDDGGPMIPGTILGNDSVWLNVNVDGEDLSPRTRLTPVGAALQAGDADTVDGVEGADIISNTNAIVAEATTARAAEQANAAAIAAIDTSGIADNATSVSALMALIADLQNQIYAIGPTPTPTPDPVSGTTWNQLGLQINGTTNSGMFGDPVSSSSDGSIVAIGAPYYSGLNDQAGRVQVYKYEKWQRLDPARRQY